MTEPKRREQGSYISAGGNIEGVAIGNNNRINVVTREASLPKTENVDIQCELIKLQAILTQLNHPIINVTAQELETEAKKTTPDKRTVAKLLETALSYAEDLAGFSAAIEQIRPPVEATASWLGENGHKLLPLVGLTL